MTEQQHLNDSAKNRDLDQYRVGAGEDLTTPPGVRVSDTDNSLKVGSRGPSLREDFHFQEKVPA